MAKIYQYQKASDEFTEYRVSGESVTELCTIDGTTFISVASERPVYDGRLDVTETVLTDGLREQIKAASPHVTLINERVVEMIRKRYSIDDEIGILRTAPSDEATVYNSYIEEVRAWGRSEKALLGLAG